MSIISDIFHLITSIVKKIFKAIFDFIKKYWWVILLVVAMYFAAPVIGSWLASIGAPTWLSSAFTAFPGWINGILSSVGSAIASGASSAWAAFSSLSFGEQALVALGAALAIDPDDTIAAIGDVAHDVGDAAGGVVGGIVSGATGLSITGWIVIGLGAYFLLRKKDDSGDSAQAQGA